MGEFFHRKIERNAIGFVLAIIAVASIGGFVEIAPLFTIDETVETAPDMRVYTPLELTGRNIYIREGCYACHSQMVRTLRDEVERYGPYSLAVESKYDHPMLWGSKRTGPDLARLGGKYSDAWHVTHLINPREVVPQSVKLPTAIVEDPDFKEGQDFYPDQSDNFFVGNSFPTCGINFTAQEIMGQTKENQ